jgi:hypothetical protein
MMSEGSPGNSANSDVRCPTCGAWQDWSDACRRCRCDLTLLRRVAEAIQTSRRHCLCALRAGRTSEALQQARRFQALCADRSAARLLAVCHLLQGDWLAAATVARIADRQWSKEPAGQQSLGPRGSESGETP